MSEWKKYSVWRQQHTATIPADYTLTGYTVKARTSKEAQSKLAKGFKGAGFHSMSLLAMPVGVNPNE